MASIDTGGGGGGKKGSPKRINTRVDFTPMVDMNMLLLTFFMFCTTLSKPQVMDIAMPVPPDDIDMSKQDKDTAESQAYTFILAKDNNVYYYNGKIDESFYEDYTKLQKTSYPTKDNPGFRKILREKNKTIIDGIKELRAEKDAKGSRMTEDEYKKKVTEIKKNADKEQKAPVIVIKPMADASYKNLVDILDEMAINNIGRYAIVDVTESDEFLVENYETKGETYKSRKPPVENQNAKPRRRR